MIDWSGLLEIAAGVVLGSAILIYAMILDAEDMDDADFSI